MKSPRALTQDQEPNAASRLKEKRQPTIENGKTGGTVTTIRAARLDDIPKLIEMERTAFEQRGDIAFIDFDEVSCATSMDSLINVRGAGILLVAQSAGQIVGMIGCIFFRYYINDRTWVAQEIFRFVEPGFIDTEMIEEIDLEAARWGAHVFLPASTFQGARLAGQVRGSSKWLS